MSRETDIAWCAGFFDGEGHISYHRGYPHPTTFNVSAQLYANIPQSVDIDGVLEIPEPLLFFQSTIGFGKILGPNKTKHKHNYRIHYGVKNAGKLFEILRPYLKQKKAADFTRALLFYEIHDPTATEEDWRRYRAKVEKANSKK